MARSRAQRGASSHRDPTRVRAAGVASLALAAALAWLWPREDAEPAASGERALPEVATRTPEGAATYPPLVEAGGPASAAAPTVAPTSRDAESASNGVAPAPDATAVNDAPEPPIDEVALRAIERLTVTYAAPALPELATYLRHADARVREAAREGVVQLGLSEGAQVLRAAADEARDAREALALLDAADFLELPPVGQLSPELITRLTEQRERERQRARTQANRQTRE